MTGFVHNLLGALAVAALCLPQPASAQFGGIIGAIAKPKKEKRDKPQTQEECENEGNVGKSILGDVIGDVVGRASGGLGQFGTYVPTAEVAGTLTNSIACRLDPAEQQQAANATLEVTRSEKVGATSEWTSATRDNVSGTSTVTKRNELAGGTTCMNVTDVIIVDGEETAVSKRMCKGPGEPRYTIRNA